MDQNDFQVGEPVRFMNEAGEGIITSLQDDVTAIVEIEGVEIPVSIDNLVKITPEEKESYDRTMQRVIRKNQKDGQETGNEPASGKVKDPRHPIPHIDLHIEKLMDDWSHLTNHEIVKFQLRTFHQFLEDAIAKREEKIIVIHGVGEGKLKSEILHLLSDYDFIRHQEAPYGLYGAGATLVTMKYSLFR